MECLRTNKHEMKNIKMGADEEWTLCDKKEVLELDISYPIEKIHAQTFGKFQQEKIDNLKLYSVKKNNAVLLIEQQQE